MTSQIQLSRFVEIGKKIVCIGRNYSEHAKELGNKLPTKPVVFLKPTSAYIVQPQQIQLPASTKEIHFEVELGIIIGRSAKNVSKADAHNYIGGYCLALDMTDRVLQSQLKKEGLPWTLAKGFDTSCPVSNFVTLQSIPDPDNVDLWLKVNGDLKQSGNTKDMIFSVPYLVSHLSECFTMEPGDLILTGTPSGVGPVTSGDCIECGIGDDIVKMKYEVK